MFPLRIPLKASLNNFTHRVSSRSLGEDFPFLMVFYFNFKCNGFTKVNHPFACGKRRTSCNELQKRAHKNKMFVVFLFRKQHLSSLCLHDPSSVIIIMQHQKVAGTATAAYHNPNCLYASFFPLSFVSVNNVL